MIWTITSKGKKMPVDYQPDPEGKFYVWRTDDGVIHAQTAKDAPSWIINSGRSTFTSHFATCPHAKHHRKRS